MQISYSEFLSELQSGNIEASHNSRYEGKFRVYSMTGTTDRSLSQP